MSETPEDDGYEWSTDDEECRAMADRAAGYWEAAHADDSGWRVNAFVVMVISAFVIAVVAWWEFQ